MIEVKKIRKIYDGSIAVNIPSLDIKNGESVGLIGNNGAGKTTLFKMMIDLVQPDTGEICINGQRVNGQEGWKKHVASYYDESFLLDYLTPEEYFYFIGSLQQKTEIEVNQILSTFHDLFNGEILKQNKYIRNFSKGNQCKIGIIGCLLQEPEVLILDEPFANIDPSSQYRLKSLLINLSKSITTIISSHDLSHITEVSDRILLMEKGNIIMDIPTNSSTLDELKQYFGQV